VPQYADRLATYSSGSGTSALTFSYVVQAGDASLDLESSGFAPAAANGHIYKAATGTVLANTVLADTASFPTYTVGLDNAVYGTKSR